MSLLFLLLLTSSSSCKCLFGLRSLAAPKLILASISDYDVFLSPLSDFKKAMDEAGLSDKVVYLDRKDAYRFKVKE